MSQLEYDESSVIDENYYFQISEDKVTDQMFVLVIYDIIDNRRRVKFAKMLEGYGFRVQKSAFEALLSKRKYAKLIETIPEMIKAEDNVRVYKIIGKGQVACWGEATVESEEIILI